MGYRVSRRASVSSLSRVYHRLRGRESVKLGGGRDEKTCPKGRARYVSVTAILRYSFALAPEAAEKWWEHAKLKIPGALPFATRSGNVCGDSVELPAPGEQWSPGVSLHGSRGRRYFRNFADISEAVGLEFSGRRRYPAGGRATL